jgi:hypothetical protein
MKKQTFVYPGSDLDNSNSLLALLGSFWGRTYTRADQVKSYVNGAALLVAQNFRNLLETVAAISRFDVPLFHTEQWTPIVLRKSQRNAVAVSVARFDQTTEKFDGKLIFDSASNTAFYAFPRPASMVSAAQVLDRLIYPTVALAENVDFKLDLTRDAIVFAVDPFTNPGLLRKAIYSGNELVDEEITLWAFQGQFDYDYVFTQFGYALGMRLQTSQGYKDLMNAVMNGLVNGGATAADLDLALSALTGIPLSVAVHETVEVMQRDAAGTLIITDQHVYRFLEDATPVVAVGDVLSAGSRLVDALTIVPLGRGTIPATVAALALDDSYLAACFYGDLIFENKNVPLEVNEQHPSGYTYLKFGLGGFPGDVEKFFDELHMRGVDAAERPQPACPPGAGQRCTLAHFLDRRSQPAGEPTAANLPTTINPLQFIAANVLRNNVFLVQIKGRGLGRNHMGLYNIRHLRQLLPPHAAMIVIYELGAQQDTLDGTQNLTENLTTFTGTAPRTDVVGNELVHDRGVTVRVFSGTCQ